ncbi:hypothetical protein GCM10025859_65030 [Alicyclobacillus fastidiosus]|nr:hypothetical protein GCM10025859_65030 [Alicyclobacillus fastidiosus]
MPLSHVSSPANSSDLEYADKGFITLIPEYRGYADSDGTVPDLSGQVLDVNNAIKAIQSRYSIEPDHIYLEGTSMGGELHYNLQLNEMISVL